MANNTDPPARACELVGRFLYYFGRVEAQLDEGITKLFNLDAAQAPIITSNIDFVKKANIVETAARSQAKSVRPVSVDIEKTFGRIRGINDARVIVAHSSFEEAVNGDGVQLKRTVAKGELTVEDRHWTEAIFETHYERLRRLEGDLKRIILELDPKSIDWSVAAMSLYAPTVFVGVAGLTDAARSTTEGMREPTTIPTEGE